MPEFLDDPSDQQEIQQMLDTLYPILNKPGTKFYLPQFVVDNYYDPYTVNTPWVWTLSDPTTLQTATTACGSIALNDTNYPCTPNTDSYIADPSVMPVLTLQPVVFNGFSNAFSQQPTCAADGVTITQTIDFSTLGAPLAPQVTITGSFVLLLNCCCSTDGTTCVPSSSEQQKGTGTFVATIPSSSITIVFVITALAPGVLTLSVSSVTFNVPNGNNGLPNVQVSVKILSAGDIQAFNNLANEAFNSATGLTTILSNVQTFLNSSGSLTLFGSIVTKEIDGYLQQNQLYPFNGATLSLI